MSNLADPYETKSLAPKKGPCLKNPRSVSLLEFPAFISDAKSSLAYLGNPLSIEHALSLYKKSFVTDHLQRKINQHLDRTLGWVSGWQ